MPSPSSQSQSQSQSLKRKPSSQQPSISSFFTKAAPSASSTTANKAQNGGKKGNVGKVVEKEKSPIPEVANGNLEAENGDEDEEDEDIVLPAQKRARINGYKAPVTSRPHPVREKKKSPETVAEDVPEESMGTTATEEVRGRSNQPTSSAGRTDKFRFGSSPQRDNLEGNDLERQRREKEKLHQKFVKRLGGADCTIGIGRKTALDEDSAVAGEDAEGDEEEEPAPPPSKAKGGKKSTGKLTPMEKQVLEIKRKHQDTVLVVEVGYKFRFFGEDAKIAAKELSIVCIPGKLRYDEHPSEAHLDRFASASIPVHRLHVHVKRLVAAGHKVGVVRQIETAALKAAGDNRNAPFVRKLTNLYTKGTYIDEVDGPEAHTGDGGSPATGYLLCITESNTKGWGNDEKVTVGIVAVQPATGDVIYDDFEDGFMRSEIETRLLHIAPCEFLIVGDLSKASEKLVQHLSGNKTNVFGDKVRVERVSKPKTAAAESHSHVSSFYAGKMKATEADGDAKASNLLEKVLKLPEDVTVCLSAMIKHMTEYGLEHVFDLTKYFQSFSARSHMLLNGNTLSSLEIYQNQTDHTIKGSLFWTLDRTRTRFGQRLLRKWVGRPLLDKGKLEERVAAVEELKDPTKMYPIERLKSLLSKVKSDLEKSLIRIYYGKCSREELVTFLQTMQMISNEFAGFKPSGKEGFHSPTINESISALPAILDDVVTYLDKVNLQAVRTKDKYNFFREAEETEAIGEEKLGIASVEHELDEHRAVAAKTLERNKVNYSTVAGIEYLIEVENSSYQIKRVPASWAKISGTKKVSRFHTPEVVRLIRERDQHREALSAACDKAFSSLLADVSAKYQSFRDCIQSLATLDCLLSLAVIASQPGYVKPQYTNDTKISVQEGRHPMVEQLLLDTYVPNDINLSSDDTRALLVTGPNMGGKSSYVRQVALIAVMGQIGSYVPAKSATLGMLDAVFTRMGAFDNMMAGESTFMVELSETADILKQATPRSLIILDELGRGTSTHDGVAIAQAVLDYAVRNLRSLTLFITHYQHLSGMARGFPNGELRNVHMKFTETGKGGEDITFLYEVGEGVAHRSYGLNVARLANVPASVLETAKVKSGELEEKICRKKMAGLVRSVGEVVASGDGDGEGGGERMFERLLSGIEEL
ncbi:Mismatch repair protein msh3 [Arachnomyces sp. PD_36]|nr:Mismatch repair protein msh3 [Arachnomyces sp. PD_36]